MRWEAQLHIGFTGQYIHFLIKQRSPEVAFISLTLQLLDLLSDRLASCNAQWLGPHWKGRNEMLDLKAVSWLTHKHGIYLYRLLPLHITLLIYKWCLQCCRAWQRDVCCSSFTLAGATSFQAHRVLLVSKAFWNWWPLIALNSTD